MLIEFGIIEQLDDDVETLPTSVIYNPDGNVRTSSSGPAIDIDQLFRLSSGVLYEIVNNVHYMHVSRI